MEIHGKCVEIRWREARDPRLEGHDHLVRADLMHHRAAEPVHGSRASHGAAGGEMFGSIGSTASHLRLHWPQGLRAAIGAKMSRATSTKRPFTY